MVMYKVSNFDSSQHKSPASAARMLEQHYTIWPVTVTAPWRSHTVSLFQYGLNEIIRVHQFKHNTSPGTARMLGQNHRSFDDIFYCI